MGLEVSLEPQISMEKNVGIRYRPAECTRFSEHTPASLAVVGTLVKRRAVQSPQSPLPDGDSAAGICGVTSVI